MRHIFILLLACLATFALTSCSNNAEGAIKKLQSHEKEMTILEARLREKTSEQKIDFFKKMYNLDDIDFISIYPLLDSWEDEADITIDINDEAYFEKYDALVDRRDELITQIEERLERIGYDY